MKMHKKVKKKYIYNKNTYKFVLLPTPDGACYCSLRVTDNRTQK